MRLIDPEVQTLLRHLWGIGAVQVDLSEGGGFTFAHHQFEPGAPRSPIRINLRTALNAKPGPITPTHATLIARALWQKVEREQLDFGGVAPIPNAGLPLGKAFVEEAYYLSARVVPLAELEKLESDGVREGMRLKRARGLPREARVLLFDDVLTKGTSKRWPVEVLRHESFDVRDCLVVVDRQEGGEAVLQKLGVRLHSLIQLRDMLGFYRDAALLSQRDHDAIVERLDTEAPA